MRSEFIRIGKANFCEENGYYCRYMDRFGHCIATSCRAMMALEEQREIEARAKYEQELMDGRIDLYDAAIREIEYATGLPGIDIEED